MSPFRWQRIATIQRTKNVKHVASTLVCTDPAHKHHILTNWTLERSLRIILFEQNFEELAVLMCLLRERVWKICGVYERKDITSLYRFLINDAFSLCKFDKLDFVLLCPLGGFQNRADWQWISFCVAGSMGSSCPCWPPVCIHFRSLIPPDMTIGAFLTIGYSWDMLQPSVSLILNISVDLWCNQMVLTGGNDISMPSIFVLLAFQNRS